MTNRSMRQTRREFLETALAMPAAFVLASPGEKVIGGLWHAAAAPQPPQLPTPSCPDPDDVTLRQTEGPFFKPSSPRRTSLLEPGITGTKVIVAGHVLSTACKPIAGALVDFWHADDRGDYDNTGFRLRGHQFTDGAGRYALETIVPGLYPGRTRHFHVKVQAANQPVLTTQLYFPGEPRNQADGIFNPKLVMMVRDTASGKAATFNFILRLQ